MSLNFKYRPAQLVKAARWCITFYAFDDSLQKLTRFREYHGINRIKDLEEREKAAMIIVTRLNTVLLPNGYPFKNLTVVRPDNYSIENGLAFALEIKYRSDRKDTISTYKAIGKSFLEFIYSKNWQLRDIKNFTFVEAMSYMDYLIAVRKISNVTYNNHRLFMVAIWNELISRSILTDNVFSKIKKLKVTEKQRRMMTFDEGTKILSTAWIEDKELAICILLLQYCFIRPGEQRKMKGNMFNFATGNIMIPGSISKNKRTEFITIPNKVIPLLISLGVDKIHPYDFLFGEKMKPSSKKMVGENTLYNRHQALVKRLVKSGKLHSSEGITLYSWKDTGAMQLLKNGIDAFDLMKQMRHQELATTQKYLSQLGNVNKFIKELKGDLILPIS